MRWPLWGESSAMRIALIAHDSRKELMAQFCTAYVRILSENDLIATGVTGKIVHDATGLPVRTLYPGGRGGAEQIAAMIGCGEVAQTTTSGRNSSPVSICQRNQKSGVSSLSALPRRLVSPIPKSMSIVGNGRLAKVEMGLHQLAT